MIRYQLLELVKQALGNGYEAALSRPVGRAGVNLAVLELSSVFDSLPCQSESGRLQISCYAASDAQIIAMGELLLAINISSDLIMGSFKIMRLRPLSRISVDKANASSAGVMDFDIAFKRIRED